MDGNHFRDSLQLQGRFIHLPLTQVIRETIDKISMLAKRKKKGKMRRRKEMFTMIHRSMTWINLNHRSSFSCIPFYSFLHSFSHSVIQLTERNAKKKFLESSRHSSEEPITQKKSVKDKMISPKANRKQ